MVRKRCDLISQLPVPLMNEMRNTVAKMNYYASLVELDQEEIKNFEVILVGAIVGG